MVAEVTTQNTTHVHTLATHPGTLNILYYTLNILYLVLFDGVDLFFSLCEIGLDMNVQTKSNVLHIL